jgi:UDP-N-acetylglucosamine 2-epimerase (non-hydrolysing)
MRPVEAKRKGVALHHPEPAFQAAGRTCFLQALRHCHLVLSDSGGLQEEALALGRPILIMREVTERPEAVDSGGARLTGTDADAIVRAVGAVLDDPASHARMAAACNPFGDGKAAHRIAAFLKRA